MVAGPVHQPPLQPLGAFVTGSTTIFALRLLASLRANARELISSLAFARSEASKRNANIVVLPVTNAPNGWSGGWCTGPATSDNCLHADVITHYQPTASDVTITSTYLESGNRLTFRRDGTLLSPGAAAPFKITSARLTATSSNARCVNLNGLGKATITKVKPDVDC